MATIEGNVVLDGGLESGVTVKAIDDSGTELAKTTSAADGTYSLTAALPCWVGALYDDGSQLYATPFVRVKEADPETDGTDVPDAPTSLSIGAIPDAPTNLTITQ